MSMKMWTQATKGTHFFILPIPAYAGLPILFWIFIQTMWALLLAFAVCGVLSYLKMKGRSVRWVIGKTYSKLRGEVVYSRPFFYRRRMQSLGSFDLIELNRK